MKLRFHFLVAVVLVIGISDLYAGKNCTQIPIKVTIVDSDYTIVDPLDPLTKVTLHPLVTSDGQGTYVDGEAGVVASLNPCSLAEKDGLLSLNKSSRSYYVTLTKSTELARNALTPGYLQPDPNNPDYTYTFHGANLTVKNILYAPSGLDQQKDSYSFTTRIWFTLIPPDRAGTQVKFVNPCDDAMSVIGAPPAGYNSPYDTSLVDVSHKPANPPGCVAGCFSPETWIVSCRSPKVRLCQRIWCVPGSRGFWRHGGAPRSTSS